MSQITKYVIGPFLKYHPSERDQLAQTPESLLRQFSEAYGEFTYDPCPPGHVIDSLTLDWPTDQNIYVNPPFNKLLVWIMKCYSESQRTTRPDRKIVLLMPVRIHTDYFLREVYPMLERGEAEFYIVPGGVRFKDYKHRAPFGVMYILFGDNNKK